ncbi:hypothetical protein [Larkinella humicola]|uniref:Uncharacterized protein n=1 Tax=Larkinella humicola TaxID=2607654 RepID=A0A5N1JSI1_9BACT|nr:hypothetical protein [Larkinella humicola]KAA9357272.1 hypothetical protein F0P93_05920 [Larkinella humicola]
MTKTTTSAETPIGEGLSLSQPLDPALSRSTPAALQAIDLTQPLPDLDNATLIPLDLASEYWSPERPGEEKRVFFVKLATSLVKPADDSDELIQLECAYFLEKVNGEVRQIRNGSKRLVGTLADAVDQGFVTQGTPMLLTYMGKKRNRTNSFSADVFSVKPLRVNVGA